MIVNDGADTDANWDIVEAYIGNSADYQYFYFRVNLAGTGILPSNGDALEARLDCDRNGFFTDAVDVTVFYAKDFFSIPSEQIIECQGNDYPGCSGANSDWNLESFGEEISGPPSEYEWSTDTINGNTNWSQCLGTVDVQFASINPDVGPPVDLTATLPYNAPNSVTLSNIIGNSPLAAPITGIVIGL
ncbi:MAG: hypothetical protein P1S60_17625, partial [Anaerolineae bacterium]|nr:hypothetical protein [Anaerolineae bacterium]